MGVVPSICQFALVPCLNCGEGSGRAQEPGELIVVTVSSRVIHPTHHHRLRAPRFDAGPEYLRKNSGKVATEEFVASHPVDIIERTLSTEQMEKMMLGPVDTSSIKSSDVAVYDAKSSHGDAGDAAAMSSGNKPGLESCINIYDFEAIASRTVAQQGVCLAVARGITARSRPTLLFFLIWVAHWSRSGTCYRWVVAPTAFSNLSPTHTTHCAPEDGPECLGRGINPAISSPPHTATRVGVL